MVIAPVFLKETVQLIKELECLKIPYVFINVEINELDALSFIGQDSFAGGIMCAKMLDLICPQNSEFVIVDFRQNVDNYSSILNRINGFKAYLLENDVQTPVVRINLDADHKELQIVSELNRAIKDKSKMYGFFVPSSKIHLIASCLTDEQKSRTKLIGFDTIPKNVKHLRNKTIDFLINQKPTDQGYKGIQILAQYLIYNEIPKKKHLSPIELITQENIDFIDFE